MRSATDGVATKTDLITLDANLKAEIARLKVWLIGSIIAIAAFSITIDKLFK